MRRPLTIRAAVEYYTYNVEAMLTLFWAVALTYTVFKFANFTTSKRVRQRTNQSAKLVAVILPAILMALLRVQKVQNSHVAFLILANFNSKCIPHLNSH